MSTDTIQSKLGRVIRARRERLGYSQEGFADHIGVHRTYYGAVERGKQNLTLRMLEQIAAGLGAASSRLLHEAETRPEEDFPPPRGPGRPRGRRLR